MNPLSSLPPLQQEQTLSSKGLTSQKAEKAHSDASQAVSTGPEQTELMKEVFQGIVNQSVQQTGDMLQKMAEKVKKD